MSGIPRSLRIGNSCCYDPLTRVWGELGKQTVALHVPWRSHLESKQSTYTRGESEDGKVRRRKRPIQGYFSLLLDGKLTCCLCRGYIIFRLRDESPNIKLIKFNNTAFWPKSPNLMPAKFFHHLVFTYYMHSFVASASVSSSFLPTQ